MKKKLIISFSAGETSAYMTQYLLNNYQDEYEMIVVFDNTGQENESTLEFARECDRHFGFNLVFIEAITNPIHKKGITAKVVTFETASRNGEPFEAMIAKHGIPNMKAPHCSRELKKYATEAYARQIGWKDYYIAIGIRIDEKKRMTKNYEKKNILYPLATNKPMSKIDINTYWAKMPFRLALKGYEGNCMVCWKKSLRKLMTIAIESPEKFDFFERMEKKYENFIPDSRKHNESIKLPI